MSGVFLALFGSTLYSVGVIMQKKGSGWMAWKNKINYGFISVFFIWIVGMLFSYAIAAVPLGIASKSLTPHMVSAISGWSIVVIAFLSYFILKEKLHFSDIIFSVVIIGCIFLMARLQKNVEGLVLNTKYLFILLFAPFLLLIPVFFRITGVKSRIILLSVFSGFLSGLTIVFMNILVKESGGAIREIVGSANLYIYFAAGVASVVAKQAAYRLGDVVLFTPLQASFSMVYPLLCTCLLFSTNITMDEIILVFVIMLSCWGIQKKR